MVVNVLAWLFMAGQCLYVTSYMDGHYASRDASPSVILWLASPSYVCMQVSYVKMAIFIY